MGLCLIPRAFHATNLKPATHEGNLLGKPSRVAASSGSFSRVRIREDLTSRGQSRKISIVFDIFHLARKKSQRLRMLRA
jgi:hypothetical protein